MKIKNLIIAVAFFLMTPHTFAAKMALSPNGGELISGCQHRINIVINTEGVNSRAADAFLSYNPAEIDIIDQLANIGGTQLRPGSVYESYPGNQVNNGVIRLTAFNRIGFFNGRGNLASFVIQGKPGIEQTTINFNYSPGQSTDSNVANAESVDVLNGAYGATFHFKKGSCGSDKTPPVITEIYPENNAMLAPLDTNIEFTITDTNSGVDIDQLKVDINGVIYSKEGENSFNYSGSPAAYRVTIDPPDSFSERKPINIKIQAQDKAGNSITNGVYQFNQFMPVEACQSPEPITCEDLTLKSDLRPAAPAKGSPGFIIFLLILLALSLLLNIELLWKDDRLDFNPHFMVKKIRQNRKKKA